MRLGAALLKAAKSTSACIVVDDGEGEFSVKPLPDNAAFVFKANSPLPVPLTGSYAVVWDEMFKSAMSGKLAPVPGKNIKRRKVK